MRPIAIYTGKETNLNSCWVKEELLDQINELSSFFLSSGHEVICCVFISLLDQKVLGVFLGEDCAANCPLCGATPTQMSDENHVCGPVNPLALTMLCVSQLHFGLAILRFILNLGYNQDFEEPTVGDRSDPEWAKIKKELKADRIHHTQKTLFKLLGIRVKECAEGGAGSSEDGNTFRRAFCTPEARKIMSEVCNVRIEFIEGLYNVYVALCSCLHMDPQLLQELCQESLDMYYKYYSWYRLPSAVHKNLVHSHEIVAQLPSTITIGIVS